MNIAHEAFGESFQLTDAFLDYFLERTLFAENLQTQLQGSQVLAQAVVKFARDTAALGFLGVGKAAQDLAVGVFGTLTLQDFGLEGLVSAGQLGGAQQDAFLQSSAFELQGDFGLFERLFRALPLDGIADGARRLASVGLALDQVVLDALAHRGETDGFVFITGQHDDRQMGGGFPGAQVGFRALAVGQRQVQQEKIERALVHLLERLLECFGVFELKGTQPALGQAFLQQGGVGRAIFHQQDSDWHRIHDRSSIDARFRAALAPNSGRCRRPQKAQSSATA